MTDIKSSWLEIPNKSDFSLYNIPFGIGKRENADARVYTRLGDIAIDLTVLTEEGSFDDLNIPDLSVFYEENLNSFIGLGKGVSEMIRQRIAELFDRNNSEISQNASLKEKLLTPVNELQMLMPVQVGDYTDFYSSREHATNVGSMFRDPDNALLPNWLHLPVGYHGRASSIIVSEVPVHRPKGQMKPADADKPVFGPTKLLDFELELAFITCKNTSLGESVPVGEAEDAIWGMVLFNDWSARDIQTWEYVPLGPFLAKNFASSMSPWVVTLDALEPFRVEGPTQEPEVLPYLRYSGKKNFDIDLEVLIEVAGYSEQPVCYSNFKYMYWNMAQQLAHQTVNGCNIRVGDIYASGTISGKDKNSYGSMLELTWRGQNPIKMPDGSERKFINDGDTVIMRGWSERDGKRVGFGEVRTKVLPAL